MSKSETASLSALRDERSEIDEQIAVLTARRAEVEDTFDDQLGGVLDKLRGIFEAVVGLEAKPKRKRTKAPASE